MNITGGEPISLKYLALTFKACIRYLRYSRLPKATNRRCIIAGNGPSLREAVAQHSRHLAGADIFCLNQLVDSDLFERLRPKHYCLVDPAFFSAIVPPEEQRVQDRIFQALNSKTTWEMHVFFPLFPNQIDLQKKLRSEHLHLHMCNVLMPFTWPVLRNYVYRTGLLAPPVNNVMNAALFLSLNMGYKEIWILGAEHSWTQSMLIKSDNILYVTNNSLTATPKECQWRLPARTDGKTLKMHEVLHALHRTFKSYWLLQEYADHLGAKIYNATEPSFIDAFARRGLNDDMSEHNSDEHAGDHPLL